MKKLNKSEEKVIALLHNERVEANYVSPNFVSEFALNRGIKLSSKSVVTVSDLYIEREVIFRKKLVEALFGTPKKFRIKSDN